MSSNQNLDCHWQENTRNEKTKEALGARMSLWLDHEINMVNHEINLVNHEINMVNHEINMVNHEINMVNQWLKSHQKKICFHLELENALSKMKELYTAS